MLTYLFTYHAYLSWLPDRHEGYTERGKGIQPRDMKKAAEYREKATHGLVRFDDRLQRIAIDELLIAVEKQTLHLHAVATDDAHLHVLVSWHTEKTWKQARNGLKYSLTRRFNNEFGTRPWFVENASRRRVYKQKHFDYLVEEYLPSHRGWKWNEERGLYL